MNSDTFWSDTMRIILSGKDESSIDAPESVITLLSHYLSNEGYSILKTVQSDKGKNIDRPHNKTFLECGADKAIVKHVESFLKAKGVTFTRHYVTNDDDCIDINFDLNDLSVWQ